MLSGWGGIGHGAYSRGHKTSPCHTLCSEHVRREMTELQKSIVFNQLVWEALLPGVSLTEQREQFT